MPDRITTSGRRYPAQLLNLPDIALAMKHASTVQINWAQDKKTFTLAARIDEYRWLYPKLVSAMKDIR